MNLDEHLETITACRSARDWVRAEGIHTAEEAWTRCERGDRLLWWWGTVDAGDPWSDKRRPLVGAAMECAARALPIFEAKYPGDHRVRACIDGVTRWARGEEVPRDELVRLREECAHAAYGADAAAYDAAYDAADAATHAAYDAYAAHAAAAYAAHAAAACAAHAAAYAASAAATADDAASAAAATTAYADARLETLKACAEIVRRWRSTPPWREEA